MKMISPAKIFIMLLSMALISSGCPGPDEKPGGDSTGSCTNVAGTWSTTGQVNATACGTGSYTEYGSYTVTQSGCNINVTGSHSFSGTVSGSTVSLTGSYPENGGTTTTTSTLTVSGTSLSGTANWTWSGSGSPSSCSGSTSISGTLTSTGGATTVTDIDGNVYNTVTIGTQVWMKENLKVTKYRNGDIIGTTTPTTKDISSESSPKYQWAYSGNESNASTYGRLYTWYAVTDSRGACPTGWHVPTDTEWTALTDYLGGTSVAGGKMKEAGTTHWSSPNESADNSSGFTALPGGYRYDTGAFPDIGLSSRWWSATAEESQYAWYRTIGYLGGGVNRNSYLKGFGFSVRCVMDSTGGGGTTTVTDIDSNIYNTVTIGTQVWMKENLKATKYRNGDMIGTTTPATKDISGESSPKYQWAYNGNESNVSTYGRLYTWYAATDSRGICPSGWHVPTDAEWTTLTDYLGGLSVAGGTMKEAGTTHWNSPNTSADNSSGFTALPDGSRGSNGGFYFIGLYSSWWSATEFDTTGAFSRTLFYNSADASRDEYIKYIGYNVRCVRD